VFGTVDGVIRTRVGYCGGTKTDPSYHHLGDHTETIQMDFDPQKISLEKLLDIFWTTHNPTFNKSPKQYMSAIFYHNQQQKEIAEKSMEKRTIELGKSIYTKIIPYNQFTLAEDYHQKYYLRRIPNCKELLNLKSDRELVDSPVATKLNAYIVGYGDFTEIQKYLESLDIKKSAKEKLLSKLSSVHKASYPTSNV